MARSPRWRRNRRLKCLCGGYWFPHRIRGGYCYHNPQRLHPGCRPEDDLTMNNTIPAFELLPDDVAFAGRVLQTQCHGASSAAGWWRDNITGQPMQANPATFAVKLMLCVSELAESMEGDRKRLADDKLPQYDMRAVELADAAIRIFDLAGAYGYDLGAIIAAKMAFNAQRPDHKLEARQALHGKAY